MRVSPHDVEALALGGAFLATGGGGDTLIGEILAHTSLTKHGAVELLSLDTLSDDALVVAIGGVGSPTIMQEKPGNGSEPHMALDALERHLGKKASALIAFEAGGVNGLLPFCLAAERGLPVVDADGMGRAFPEIQMESFAIYGVSPTPLAAATELGDVMLLSHARDATLTETILRHFAVQAGGGQCTSAEHSMSGETVKRVAIPGTISLCIDIGILLLEHGNRIDAFVAALRQRLAPTHYGEVRTLMTGKVIDVTRQVIGGYDYGTVHIEGFSDSANRLDLSIKNEYLTAVRDGVPVTLTPDLIILLDNETGRPITAETLQYGQRVTALGIGAPALMRTPQALQAVAPRCFGYDFDYTPIEELLPKE